MIDPSKVEFLEGGCALIIATVDDDGAPYASRGWGLDVLDPGAGTVRLHLDASDSITAEHCARGGAVAITAADVRTLRSLQLKGRGRDLADGDETTTARANRYAEAFFGDVVAVDGTDPRLPARILPTAFSWCIVDVTDQFDQTPGPAAGTPLREP